MANETPTADEWSEAMATETLDLKEMDQMVAQNKDLWDDYEGKKKVASEAFKLAEASDHKILTALKNAGKSKYFVDGFGTVSIIQKSTVRVPGTIEQKRKLFAYLNEQGEDVFMSLATINSQTLNSWYNEALEAECARVKADGGALNFSIPGIEEPTMRESLRFLKAKKGK